MRLVTSMTAIAAAAMLVAFAAPADAKKRAAGPKTYQFCIQCPVLSFMPWTVRTCAAKGATAEAARTTCQTQNNFCYIRNYNKKTCSYYWRY